jgi:uncharacterized oligopeptide transporter (OPT) family protein
VIGMIVQTIVLGAAFLALHAISIIAFWVFLEWWQDVLTLKI